MTTSSRGKLRVFISHSNKDDSFCMKTVKNLRKIFGNDAITYDKKGGLDGAEYWWRQIAQEISRCDTFILIVSPEAMNSIWVRHQFLLARAQNKQIIPLLYRKCECWQELKHIPTIQFHSSQTYDDDFEMLLQAIETIPPDSSGEQVVQVSLRTSAIDTELRSPTNTLPIIPGTDRARTKPLITNKLAAQRHEANVPSTPAASISPVKAHTEPPHVHLPRIFVSYSSIDDAFNTRLIHDLRSITGDNDTVWNDPTGGLHNSDSWWPRIQREVSERPVFIVILSPSAVTSNIVNEEIRLAWSYMHVQEQARRIVPLLYRHCDIPDSLKTLDIISFLDPWTYDHSFSILVRMLSQPL
jgi:hypothetical protein